MTQNTKELDQKCIEYVVELRDAAYHHDWQKCEQISRNLFRLLAPDNVIHIVVHQLITHLPIFERFHPDVKWSRIFLLQFLDTESKNKVFDFPFYRETYTSPGSQGFTQALGFLADIEKSRRKPDQYTFDLAVDTITLIIHSKRLVLWAMEHPDEWQLWIKSDGRPVKIRSLGIESLTIQEAVRDSWLNIVVEINKVLNIKA